MQERALLMRFAERDEYLPPQPGTVEAVRTNSILTRSYALDDVGDADRPRDDEASTLGEIALLDKARRRALPVPVLDDVFADHAH